MRYLLLAACISTSHPTVPAPPATASSTRAEMDRLIDTPGAVTLEQIDAADWEIPLSGLLDLDKAKLPDRPEPIHIYLYALRHPTHGLYIVDTGMTETLDAFSWHVKAAMKADKLVVHKSTRAFVSERGPLAGVMLTHLHLDHISGLPEVARGTPIFVGPGETAYASAVNAATRGTFDRMLDGHSALQEWSFGADGVRDIFGDGSVWAIHTPGHTPGSTAYVVRTPEGPALITGDTSHTRYGWEHDIAPGDFTLDHTANERSLAMLRTLSAQHPKMKVYLGHQ